MPNAGVLRFFSRCAQIPFMVTKLAVRIFRLLSCRKFSCDKLSQAVSSCLKAISRLRGQADSPAVSRVGGQATKGDSVPHLHEEWLMSFVQTMNDSLSFIVCTKDILQGGEVEHSFKRCSRTCFVGNSNRFFFSDRADHFADYFFLPGFVCAGVCEWFFKRKFFGQFESGFSNVKFFRGLFESLGFPFFPSYPHYCIGASSSNKKHSQEVYVNSIILVTLGRGAPNSIILVTLERGAPSTVPLFTLGRGARPLPPCECTRGRSTTTSL